MTVLHSFAAEAFTLLSLGIVIIGVRTYARTQQVGMRNLKADDYLMLLAIVPYTTEIVLAYTVGARFHGLANNAMTDEQRASLSPKSDEYKWRHVQVNGSKIQIAGWAVYASVLWILKSAMCAFYIRLTNGLAGYRTRIQVGFALIAATYIAIIGSIFFGCRPFHGLWQIHPDPGNVCQPASSKLLIFLVVTLNIITDIYLMLIPIPLLWKSQVPKVKKILLVLLFSGGIFVMVAGILRCILILKNPTTGPQQAGSWAVRESFVAITTSSMPMVWGWIRPKLKPFLPPLLTSSRLKEAESPEAKEVTSGDQRRKAFLENRHRLPINSAHRQGATHSGYWSTCVYDDESKPVVESTQRERVITKEVKITVSRSKAGL